MSLGMPEIILIFLVVRTFLIQTFTIVSGSMEGTLLVGDFLLVNKAVYGARVPGTDWMLPAIEEPEPFVNADPFILTDQETGRTFQPELTSACMYMNITDDMGDTWLTQPMSCGTIPVDHHCHTPGHRSEAEHEFGAGNR